MKPETRNIDQANLTRMMDNQGKPANTMNGVSFSELMRMLGGGV